MFGWGELSGLNQGLFAVAVFCTVFLIAQLLLSSSEHGHDTHVHEDVGAVLSSALLSTRSLLAFATLFSWAAALFLRDGRGWGFVLPVSAAWGLAGSGLVAGVRLAIHWAQDPGDPELSSCIGEEGTVVLPIPAGGEGEIRLLLAGRVQHVRARSDGPAFEAGARVVVLDIAAPNTLRVVHPAQLEDKRS